MAYLTEDKISTIVERVVARMLAESAVPAPQNSPAPRPVVPSTGSAKGDRGVFTDLDAAVAGATAAYRRVHESA